MIPAVSGRPIAPDARSLRAWRNRGVRPGLQADRDVNAGRPCGLSQHLALLDIEAEGIFAIDVFACGQRGEKKLAVGRERHGDRDKIDVRVAEQVGGIAVGLADAERVGCGIGRGLGLACERRKFEPRQLLNGRDVRFPRPASVRVGSDNPDPQCFHHRRSRWLADRRPLTSRW